MSPAPKITSFAMKLVFANQDRELVQGVVVQQRHKLRMSSLAMIEKEKRIGIVEVRTHKLRVGVFRQSVEGKAAPALGVHHFENSEHILLPLFRGSVQLNVKDPACHSVVGLAQAALFIH